MARPTRHNADYYTHDADLRNDRRVKAIRTKFGAAGYGLLHMLLEALTDADHTHLDTDPLEIELLAGDFGVSATEIHDLLQFGESIGYFTRNETFLLGCPELSKWLEPVFEKRNRTRNAAGGELLSQPVTKNRVSATETTQRREEKKRVENRKGGGQPANQPDSISSKSEKPLEAAKGMPEQAEVFTTAGFSAFVNKMGFGQIDMGFYLLDLQRKAELTQQPRDETGWENFVKECLKREKSSGKLLYRDIADAQGQHPRLRPDAAPPPVPQPEQPVSAFQAALDAKAKAEREARWAAFRNSTATTDAT